MDTGSGECLSASKDVTRPDTLNKLYTERSQFDCHSPRNISIDDLGNSLIEGLSVRENQILPSKSISCQPSKRTGNHNVETEDECEDPDQTESETVTSEKCLSKCATFPCSCKKSSLAVLMDGEDDITVAVSKQSGCESVKHVYPQSIILPTALKLVSTMKGSREKQGTTLKKFTVTWAPDVYDPLPSTPTFVRNNKSHPKNERKKKYDKKNGKNKQKGRPSKCGGSKDKKHVRKYGESSNNCYLWRPNNDDDTIVDMNEPCMKLGDFDVGSPDAYCGSSFLKTSITKLHFSIAEAK